MKKVAVIIAPGFEEGEALTIVDILRRGQIQCDTIGFEKEVQGGHEIVLRCDSVLNESLLDYDMVVLSGGYDGIEAMKENKQFLSLLQSMNKDHKYICAMCAAPAALEKENRLINKKFTAYQGYENKINLLTLSILCMCLFTILHTSITGISQYLSSIALSVQLSTKIGATFMSLTMIGNICTKLLIGFLTNVGNTSSLITLIGYLYDFTKSYQVVFIIALFFHLINLMLLLEICSRYNNKGDRNEIL